MSTLSPSHPTTALGFETSFVTDGCRSSWLTTTCTAIAASGRPSIGTTDAFSAGSISHQVPEHQTRPCSAIAYTASRGDGASPRKELARSLIEPLPREPHELSPRRWAGLRTTCGGG